jgi:hypothetical protein
MTAGVSTASVGLSSCRRTSAVACGDGNRGRLASGTNSPALTISCNDWLDATRYGWPPIGSQPESSSRPASPTACVSDIATRVSPRCMRSDRTAGASDDCVVASDTGAIRTPVWNSASVGLVLSGSVALFGHVRTAPRRAPSKFRNTKPIKNRRIPGPWSEDSISRRCPFRDVAVTVGHPTNRDAARLSNQCGAATGFTGLSQEFIARCRRNRVDIVRYIHVKAAFIPLEPKSHQR